jgi:pyrroline-5-carboxylate reductase
MSRPIWLIGAGNMGGAMLRGWIARGIDPADVTVIDPFAQNIPELVTLLSELPEGGAPDTLVLATKPQQLHDLAAVYAGRVSSPRLLVSVLAGVETLSLRKAFNATHIVRAMPNLPAAIGQGATVLYGSTDDAAVRLEATALMAPLGTIDWIEDEALFDVVTGLSGSGPGYVFRFIEAMAEAGAVFGLSPQLAERLAITTVRGSALLAERSDATPAQLADRVASPGGTTREGLNVLDEDRALKDLVLRTVSAAKRRSEELAAMARA